MAGQLRYELIGDASQFVQSQQQAIDANEQMEASLDEMRGAIARVTEGQAQLKNEQGEFVSSAQEAANVAEVQAAALQELNAEGVQTTQQLQEQINRLEDLQEIYRGDAIATRELTDQIQRLETKLSEVGVATAQQERNLTEHVQQLDRASVAYGNMQQRQQMLQREYVELASSQSRVQTELRETAAAQDRVASSGVTMRSSASAAANNLGFELAQAAQDARFGMAGVANQIPLMTEQFQQLTARTGSTSAAFSALGRSLLGPAGIVLAVTQLVQMGPQIQAWFSESGSAAENAEEKFRGFFSSIDGGLQNIDRLEGRMSDLTGTQGAFSASLEGTLEGWNRFFGALTGGMSRSAQTVLDELGAFSGPRGEDLPGETPNWSNLLFGTEAQQLEDRTQRIRSALEGTGAEADLVDAILRDLGANMDEVVGPSFDEAQDEIRAFRGELENITASPRKLISERPGAASNFFQSRFEAIEQQQSTLREFNLTDQEGALQEQVQFLEQVLSEAATRLPEDTFQAQFGGMAERLQNLRAELRGLQDDSEDAKDESEETSTAFRDAWFPVENALSDVRGEIENMHIELNELQGPQGESLAIARQKRRELERQIERQKDLNRLIARGLLTEEGELPGGPSEVPTAGPETVTPEDVSTQSAGTFEIAGPGGPREFSPQLAGMARDAQDTSDEIDDGINRGLTQSIQLASQLGATLVQAAQQGGAEWNQVLGSVLQTVGGIVGIANPAIGAGIAGAGTLVGSFQHGGQVTTPFQLVGEEGPEIAALPQGSEVYSHSESARFAEHLAARGGEQNVNVNIETEMQRLPGGDLGLAVRENESRREKFGYTG